MLRQLFIVSIVFFSSVLYGQNQTKKWFFGNGAAINFATAGPMLMSGCAISSSMGCASIADQNGSTLFYTDGINIYNASNAVMANGGGLPGAGSFQSSLIVQQPTSSSIYFVFTVGALGSSNGLYYSIVDMSLAAGMGSVTVKNVLVHADCRDKLTAGKNCNGTDIWVVSAAVNSSAAFVSCNVSAAGVSAAVVTPSSTSIMPVIGTGQMKISPNSHRMGIVSYLAPGANCGQDVRVMFFNNSTGMIESGGSTVLLYSTYPSSSPNCATNVYGCEFSADTRYMYLSINGQINRIDLCSFPVISVGLIPNAENTSIYDTISKRSFQLASDGKIYVAKNGKTSLGTINNPSSLFATSYSSVGLSLGAYTCQAGLPNIPGYWFEQKPPSAFSYSLSSGNCLTAFFTSSAICAGSGYSVTGYQWNFGDPGSGAANTSSLSNPIHFYSTQGTYSVTMVRFFQCNENDTITQVINVTAPIISVVNSASLCNVTTATAQVTASSGTINYLWSPGSQTTAIGTFTASGIYTVTVTDPGNGFCTVTATTAITVVNLSATAVTQSLTCNADASGSASVAVSGGSGNYQYFWTGAASTNSVIANVQASSYTVTVLDNSNFCSITKTVNIIQPPALTLSVGGATQTCLNQTVTMFASAMGGFGAVSLSWPGLGTGNSVNAIQTILGPVVYTCNALDANACAAVKTITVVCNPLPLLAVTASTLCAGANLTLQASGASSYSWSNSSLSQSIVLIAPSDGTMVLTGTTGICSTSTVITIQNLPLPALSVSSGYSLCAGQTISLSASGAGSFLWNGPNGFLSTLANISLTGATPQQSGTYAVNLSSSNSCVSSASITMLVVGLPTISISGVKSICSGESASLSVFGSGTYSWSTGQTSATIVVTPSGTTTYSALLTSTINGCSTTGSVQVNVLPCLSVTDFTTQELIKVYPLPAVDQLFVELNQPAGFSLFNGEGKLLRTGETVNNRITLDVLPLQNGLYLLNIKLSGGQEYFRKVVVQH